VPQYLINDLKKTRAEFVPFPVSTYENQLDR